MINAFALLYEEHAVRVYRFLIARVGSPEVAEDLTSLTFERALRAFERFDPERASELTWLLAIARNALIDHLRADRSRRVTQIEAAASIAAPTDEPVAAWTPELRRAVRALPERERELLGLRYAAELTGPEIADYTGLSLANVQQILSRTLRKLRAELDAQQDVEQQQRPDRGKDDDRRP